MKHFTIITNLNTTLEFHSVNTHSVGYGTESLTFLANKIWSLSLQKYKILKIELWQTDDCRCRLRKVYISQLGFV